MSNIIGPIKEIPENMIDEYTINGKIPIHDWYCDDSVATEIIWSKEMIKNYLENFTKENIEKFYSKKYNITMKKKFSFLQYKEPYGLASLLHIQAFDKYPIKNKDIVIIGSIEPWIECICINYGAKSVTTVEYNVPRCESKLITTISYNDFLNGDIKYDCAITFSSVEHSGLGRYGDPLNPEGDLETMRCIKNSLKKDGLLFWGAPVGRDLLCWNTHRIYGKIRLPMIFKGFNIKEWFGGTQKELFHKKNRLKYKQPVIVAICE